MQQPYPGPIVQSDARRGVRRRLTRAVRHVIGVLIAGAPRAEGVPPADRQALALAAGAPPRPPGDDPLVRARRALSEARAEMPLLLADPPPQPSPEMLFSNETAGLRQALRSYTDRIDRLLLAAEEERRIMREQVDRLTGEIAALRDGLAGVRAALPAREVALALAAGPAVADAVPATLSAVAPTVEQAVPAEAVADERVQLPADWPGQSAGLIEPPPVAGAEKEAETAVRPSNAGESGARVDEQVALPGQSRNEPSNAGEASAHLNDAPALRHSAAPPDDPFSGCAAGQAPLSPEEEEEGTEQLSVAHWQPDRIFAAGSIGLQVVLTPVTDMAQLAAMQAHLDDDPLIQHAQLVSYAAGEARLRLLFRAPAPWPRLRELIERAVGATIEPDGVTLTGNTLSLRLRRQ